MLFLFIRDISLLLESLLKPCQENLLNILWIFDNKKKYSASIFLFFFFFLKDLWSVSLR